MSLHILSYNIHGGLSTFRRATVAEHVTGIIQSTQADIVLLQELWLPPGAMDFIIVDSLRHVWPFQACAATVLLPRGEQGNGILSRYSIKRWRNNTLTYRRRQTRSFLHADIWLEDQRKSLALFCTHFGLLRAERLYQAEQLCQYIEKYIPKDEAILLGGDFNDWLGEISEIFLRRLGLVEVFQALNGKHARTFPCILPCLSLDRIYVRGLEIEAARVIREAGWKGSSDHLPLATELAFSTT